MPPMVVKIVKNGPQPGVISDCRTSNGAISAFLVIFPSLATARDFDSGNAEKFLMKNLDAVP